MGDRQDSRLDAVTVAVGLSQGCLLQAEFQSDHCMVNAWHGTEGKPDASGALEKADYDCANPESKA